MRSMVDMASSSHSKARVPSVDAWRGFVMIVMALDHTREFFHSGAMSFQPDDETCEGPSRTGNVSRIDNGLPVRGDLGYEDTMVVRTRVWKGVNLWNVRYTRTSHIRV